MRRGAQGNLRVGNSTLTGDIVADDGSTANVLLEDSATLTGRLTWITACPLKAIVLIRCWPRPAQPPGVTSSGMT